MTENKQGLFERFKNRSRPRRPWIAVMAAALIAACFLVVFMFFQMGSSPAIKDSAKTTAMRDDVDSTPGGDASEEYRKKIEELNEKEAQSAEKQGRSYIASVGGQISNEKLMEKAREKENEEPEPQETNRNEPEELPRQQTNNAEVRALERRLQNMQARMEAMQQQQQQRSSRTQSASTQPRQDSEDYSRQYGKQLAQMNEELNQGFSRQQIQVFEDAVAQASGDNEADQDRSARQADETSRNESDNQDDEQDDGQDSALSPGDILYARNEVMLNSDAPGPAQATVLSGEYRGAKALGAFDKTNDYLNVSFNRLIMPDGAQYGIEAVAIDPDVSASAVRSDVDRHIFQRWGGLMAASFLAGFGESVKDSGSEVSVSDGTTVSSRPSLDTEEQMWVAAGRVGEELSSVLKKNFDRPSTVTLDPGVNIGILVLSAEQAN